MKPSSAKAKGRRFTVELAERIVRRLSLHEADVRTVPSGVNGPDLWLSAEAQSKFPFVVECKNQEQLRIFAALAQAAMHAVGTELVPLLAFKRNRSETYVSLHIEDFLDLIGELNQLKFGIKNEATGGEQHVEESSVLF